MNLKKDELKNDERAAFAERLTLAIDAAGAPWNGGITAFMRSFNAVYDGAPVTVHAARKWLVGEAIPTQEKLLVLAASLGVSAQWLRFGDDEVDLSVRAFNAAERHLVDEFNKLPGDAQKMVRSVMRQLAALLLNTADSSSDAA